MREQEQVAEGGSEVRAVQVRMFGRAWMIRVVTARTENFHGEFTGNVREADGQHWLALAERSRTPAEIDVLELLILQRHTMMISS